MLHHPTSAPVPPFIAFVLRNRSIESSASILSLRESNQRARVCNVQKCGKHFFDSSDTGRLTAPDDNLLVLRCSFLDCCNIASDSFGFSRLRQEIEWRGRESSPVPAAHRTHRLLGVVCRGANGGRVVSGTAYITLRPSPRLRHRNMVTLCRMHASPTSGPRKTSEAFKYQRCSPRRRGLSCQTDKLPMTPDS